MFRGYLFLGWQSCFYVGVILPYWVFRCAMSILATPLYTGAWAGLGKSSQRVVLYVERIKIAPVVLTFYEKNPLPFSAAKKISRCHWVYWERFPLAACIVVVITGLFLYTVNTESDSVLLPAYRVLAHHDFFFSQLVLSWHQKIKTYNIQEYGNMHLSCTVGFLWLLIPFHMSGWLILLPTLFSISSDLSVYSFCTLLKNLSMEKTIRWIYELFFLM